MNGAVLLDPPAGDELLLASNLPGAWNLPAPPRVADLPPGVAENLAKAGRHPGLRNSRNNWEEVLRVAIADATAVNTTTTETVLVPDLTLPAEYLVQGRAMRLTARGRFGTTATPTLTFAVRMGGVAGVVVVTSAAYTTPSGVTTVPFFVTADLVVRSGGSAGTIFGMGNFQLSTAAPNTLAMQHMPATAPAVSAAIDMTAAQSLSLTVDWSASSASNTITAHQYIVESLN